MIDFISTKYTRIDIPDGTGRTVSGYLDFTIGEIIRKGDVVEWPELNGYRVTGKSQGFGSKFERGYWHGGTCTYLRLGGDDA